MERLLEYEDGVEVPYLVVDGENIQNNMDKYTTKEELVELLQPLVGKMMYLNRYETTPKQGIVRGIIHGQPIIIKEVRVGEVRPPRTYWGFEIDRCVEFYIEYPKISESVHSEEINQQLKEIKVKEKSYDGRLMLLGGRAYLSTGIDTLGISYSVMMDDILEYSFERFMDAHKYMVKRLTTTFSLPRTSDDKLTDLILTYRDK